MSEWPFWSRFGLAALVVWRLTHLLAREDGPGDVFARIRARLGPGALGRLMDCFYCLSFWVAAPLALFVGSTPLESALAWPALSGAACLLERAGVPAPLMIETAQPAQKGDDDGMLRSETRSAAATTAHHADHASGGSDG